MTEKFTPGDIVDFTVQGVRVVGVGAMTGRVSTIADEHGTEYPVPPQAEVTHVAPAGWPPRPDDLWRGQGETLWFATQTDTGSPRLINSRGEVHQPEWVLNGGPLTLVRREDERDGAGS